MQHVSYLESPIGFLRILSNGDAITEVTFTDHDGPEDPDAHTESAKTQLREYMNGKRHSFQLDLAPSGTPFEKAVWNHLREIPMGSTISYGTLAKKLGEPGAAQAVGRANAKNPIAIIVPCHRVVGSDNTLTGYAGGPERKEWLLKHEGALLI